MGGTKFAETLLMSSANFNVRGWTYFDEIKCSWIAVALSSPMRELLSSEVILTTKKQSYVSKPVPYGVRISHEKHTGFFPRYPCAKLLTAMV